jgi:hypothetical protein
VTESFTDAADNDKTRLFGQLSRFARASCGARLDAEGVLALASMALVKTHEAVYQ